MKIRCSFVTNSSSSNVILALKQPLSIHTIREALFNIEEKEPEKFKTLPSRDIFDFAVYLTAYACSNSIENHLEHEKRIVQYWNMQWQAEAEKIVREFGEDNAFENEMKTWDRVYDDQNWPMPEDNMGMGNFPERALALKAEGYTFVYMFDINDFSGEDDFMTRLRDWASSIKTDDLVLEVESYY